MQIELKELNSWSEYEHSHFDCTFFDLDNTIIYYDKRDPNKLFNELWVKYNLKRFLKNGRFYGYYNPQYLSAVRDFNNNVIINTNYHKMPGFNRAWLLSGNSKLITARGIELNKTTRIALKHLCIYNIEDVVPGNKKYYSRPFKGMDRAGRSKDGKLLYCGGANKGEVLLGYMPYIFNMTYIDCKIRIIDDSLNNLLDIQTVFNDLDSNGEFNFREDLVIELIHFKGTHE